MTKLEGLIREIIRCEGPMRLDRYMGLCLGHPEFGYYMTQEPFGEAGDFITAPEISQVFGELIGIWLASAWTMLGSPSPFRLVELGPGRGTLMSDILRASRVVPGFAAVADVHLVETSPRLREMQKTAVSRPVTWHTTIETVPEGPLLLVANEFFDAIPIRQFECRGGHWFERVIGITDDRLQIGLAESPARPPMPGGAVIEIDEARTAIAKVVGERLRAGPGAALVVDYGHLKSAPGDTLQAMRRHGFVAVTEAPGDCDMTSHVDFESLGGALARGGATVLPAIEQGDFLRAMGLEARFAKLSHAASPTVRQQLQRAEERLAGADQMGKLFKVLAAIAPGYPSPYPFESS